MSSHFVQVWGTRCCYSLNKIKASEVFSLFSPCQYPCIANVPTNLSLFLTTINFKPRKWKMKRSNLFLLFPLFCVCPYLRRRV